MARKEFRPCTQLLPTAAYAHAFDMGGCQRFAASHPAAVTADDLTGSSTKKLIAGVVVGSEVMIRIDKAIPTSSLNRGFHFTGIIGPFGAAEAAASIVGLGALINRFKQIWVAGLTSLISEGSTERLINVSRIRRRNLIEETG